MLCAYPRAYILFIIFSKYVSIILPSPYTRSHFFARPMPFGSREGEGLGKRRTGTRYRTRNVLLITHVFIEKHIACLHHYVPFDYRMVKMLRTPRSKLVNKF